MLRFLACVSRSHAFDDASLDAHGLFGQALQADFSDQRGNHVLPAWCVNQTQRDQTFIHDADSLGKTDLSGGDLGLLCSLQHERADHRVGQQKRVDLLP